MPAQKVPSVKGEKVSVDLDAGLRKQTAPDDIAARFSVRELLGEGGMGSVFVAHDRGLGRVVALKRLREGFESNPDAMRRFILEAQVGAQLEHPNIVPLYSLEQAQGGAPAIAMQLLEGMTMAEYIAAAASAPKEALSMQGEYSLKERLGRLLGVCEAIHFAHERGVIHRDLKPDNVMLGRFREVYVMDWGLARVTGSAIDMTRVAEDASAGNQQSLPGAGEHDFANSATIVAPSASSGNGGSATATRQGDVMGTAQYMPPEQALGLIDQVGPAADQYALGVMLQELATLVPARSHTSSMQALSQAVMNQLAPPVDYDGNAIDPPLAAIVSRATRKEPAERYPSVKAFTDDLRRFTRDEPVSVYAEGPARRMVRAAARRPVLAIAILSLCGFLASVAVVGAVIRDAHQTKRQARVLENTRRVLLAVTDRAHVIDVELSDLAADVQATAAATVELLDRDPESIPRSSAPAPLLVPSPGYGGAAVSFDGAVVNWPGKEANVAQPPSARQLARLEPWLRKCLVAGLPADESHATNELQTASLRAGHSALMRAFVGLEDGAFVQFPAREIAAYVDPRKRPWYRMATQDLIVHWTRPVLDASRQTLRTSAVRGLLVQGKLVGVTGCDMRVSALASQLKLALPGFRRAYLVLEDGKIGVSETLEADMLAQTKNVDSDLELPSVDAPELAERIAKSDRGGYVVSGQRLIVYSRLISPPWTYVAELDRAAYLDD